MWGGEWWSPELLTTRQSLQITLKKALVTPLQTLPPSWGSRVPVSWVNWEVAEGRGSGAIPDSCILLLVPVVGGLSVVVVAAVVVVVVATVVVAMVVGTTVGMMGTVVASVVAAAAVASVLLAVPIAPSVGGGNVGGAEREM